MQGKRRMRGNGSGSITRVNGRKNPYRVRVTEGWEIDEETGKVKQKVLNLGYFKTKKEAEEALRDFQQCPYDTDLKDATFEEVYELWKQEHFKRLKNPSSKRTHESAFAYCGEIKNLKMREIRSFHLKRCIENAALVENDGNVRGKTKKATVGVQARMKSLFNLVFDYAYEHEIVNRNYARAFRLDNEIRKEIEKNKKRNVVFTQEEIEKLAENVGKVKFADMVLIGIYSGWRPQELATLKLQDIDLTNDCMTGGMKTDAGKNRVVPIHPRIRELIVRRYKEAEELKSVYLFNDPDSMRTMEITYDKYRHRFEKVMKALNMKHHPHETRHTFITMAKKAGVDEYILKKIVGHATMDITEAVYTHREFVEIQEEMKKIK
ncbi:MAG: tyrosine-type recombinase/integrase [Lachnospiraceae bacterium]